MNQEKLELEIESLSKIVDILLNRMTELRRNKAIAINSNDIEMRENKNSLGIGSFDEFVLWCINFSSKKYMEWDGNVYRIPKIGQSDLEVVLNIKSMA